MIARHIYVLIKNFYSRELVMDVMQEKLKAQFSQQMEAGASTKSS